jgi:glycosyltransferase involved in cell wall biosynthesis
VQITFEGNTRFDNSYGIVNLNLANALRERGHEVSIMSFDESVDELTNSCAKLGVKPFSLRPAGSHGVHIRQFWPPRWERPDCGTFIVIQPWEFGGVPSKWMSELGQVDQIWAYSSFVKACWVEGGADPQKVSIVPLGVHEPRIGETDKVDGQLLFLGGGIWRKGVDLFVQALDQLPDSELRELSVVIKESGGGSFYSGMSMVDTLLTRYPRVSASTRVLRDSLSRDAIDQLIAESVVLVHPYRAEGFYLGGLEAMSLDTTVIMTKGGASDDYANHDNAVLVKASEAVASNPADVTEPTAGEFHWLEADVDELTRSIRFVLDNPGATTSLREAGRQTAKDFSWDHSARVAETAIARAINRDPVVDDHFGEVEGSLQRLNNSGDMSDLDSATTLLASHGDLHAAYALLDKFSVHLPDNARQLKTQLASALDGRVDIWRSATYRKYVEQH